MSLKIENSRRVAKSRPVCMDLKAHRHRCKFDKLSNLFSYSAGKMFSKLICSRITIVFIPTH
jgi:hypothetical protein